MIRNGFLVLFCLHLSTLVSSVTICSSSSILSTFTDPLCTSWCKVRLCSSGSCRSVLSGNDPTCECESCTFGSWFGGSSDSNSNQPVTGQVYAAGSGGEMTTQNYRDSQYGYNNGYNNNNNNGYNNGYGSNGYNNGYNNGYGNNGYNNNNRAPVTAGYGNANGNFNSNQQYADQQYYNRNNQYGSSVPAGYGNAGQSNYASGYQNLKKRR
ncbi:Protein CBR-ABF-6 [Caenorhabditis briggsae]|uniref:Protein CBR-ABF-6 n=2 Tax=Caenorhabditis briggsae TaxID=6238 RepID=A0AAE8ZUT4_CAEBR|nr:Protein CBR-ABF-6 [Caenorhabditis briggsae]ULT83461.1 hypothetical protein L3Y34_012592 [Caenorhabditis briggsae]UMM42734.1 hypothetical protein L5515_018446 [Caenorhabditis briggsae]CAP21590.1 Protein CBR-ABF-6 [Caenorhabditis briggsae]